MSRNGILVYEEGVPSDHDEFTMDDTEEDVTADEFSANPPQLECYDKESFARMLRWLRWKIYEKIENKIPTSRDLNKYEELVMNTCPGCAGSRQSR